MCYILCEFKKINDKVIYLLIILINKVYLILLVDIRRVKIN